MKAYKNKIITAGVLLGIGLGGFFDGILFHQILQIHNMLSAITPVDNLINAEINMVWDGIFHALTWLMTVSGVYLLWKAGKDKNASWSGTELFGACLLGWGLFNFIEGIIDHHILGLHHVVERLGLSVYDYAFLGSGVIFMALGAILIRRSHSNERR